MMISIEQSSWHFLLSAWIIYICIAEVRSSSCAAIIWACEYCSTCCLYIKGILHLLSMLNMLFSLLIIIMCHGNWANLFGNSFLNCCQVGLSIAVRYALTRRAFSLSASVPEVLLLDYPSHQRRLLPLIAKT